MWIRYAHAKHFDIEILCLQTSKRIADEINRSVLQNTTMPESFIIHLLLFLDGKKFWSGNTF